MFPQLEIDSSNLKSWRLFNSWDPKIHRRWSLWMALWSIQNVGAGLSYWSGAGEMTHIPDRHHSHHGGPPRLRKIFTLRSLPNTSEARNFEAMEEVEHNLSVFFETPWCTKNDVQCQFHSQIYLRCIISIFVLFSFKSLGLAWLGYLCWIFLFYKHRSWKAMSPLSFRFRLMGWSKWTNQASVLTFDPCVFLYAGSVQDSSGHWPRIEKLSKNHSNVVLKKSHFVGVFFPNNGEHHLVILRTLLPGFPSAKVETEDRCVTWRILQILFSPLVMKPIPRGRCCCCGGGGGGWGG